jgi:ribonuclease P protein component
MKFPRQARLSGAEAFSAVFAKPKVSRDAYFRVLSRVNDQVNSRLGMAVSRKVCARATGRNRLKRIIRESFREQLSVDGTATARDFVVLPTPAAVAISNIELFRSLRQHWRRHWRPENDPARSDRVDADR